MSFRLLFTKEAERNLTTIEKDSSKQQRSKAVRKSPVYLEKDPKHPSLNTHEYEILSCEFGIKKRDKHKLCIYLFF